MDFFDVKGDVEALLNLSVIFDKFIFADGKHSALHPGQTSRLIYNDKEVGWLGALHPQIQQKLQLSGPIFLFEILQDALKQARFRV